MPESPQSEQPQSDHSQPEQPPSKRPHALVTGGTGFIGRSLCRALIEHGYRVTVLSRQASSPPAMPAGDLELIAELAALDDRPPVHVVVNLAGEPLAAGRWTVTRKRAFFDSRVGTTDKLYDYFAAAAQAPDVLVSGSAIGFYGAQADNILDEDGRFTPGFAHDLCAAWERAADRFQSLGTRVCKLRTGMVLGPDGGALAAMLPAFRMGLGGPIGSGRQWVSWVHRGDLVALILHCLANHDISGPVNGTAPGAVTNRDFARTLGRVLRRPAVLPAPAFAMKLLFGEMARELLLSGQRVFPRKAMQHRFVFRFADLEAALRDVLER